MKAYQILIFIFVVLLGLTLTAFFFPIQGVQIGGISLRFPTIERILTRSSASDIVDIPELEEPVLSAQDSLLLSLQDSVHYYQSLVENELGKFYFPADDIHFFTSFFQKAAQSRREQKVLRILHYGDSQIELDRITQNIRNWVQAKFGGGGPGLLPPVQYIPRGSIYQTTEGNYTIYSVFGDGKRRADKEYGMLSKCYEMNGKNHFFVRSPNSSSHYFSLVRLLFKDKKGDFVATLKDKKSDYEQTFENEAVGLQSWLWKLDTPTTSLTLSLSGTADIYGIFVDQGYGVSVDNIPIRGSSGTFFTQISDSLLRKSYQMANVGLIILQFGGNSVPYLSSQASRDAFTEKIANQIQFLRRVHPEAQILFIGPADMSQRVEGEIKSYPFLSQAVADLKEVITRNGAAYWDMFEVMGGDNSMLAWVNHGLAGPDYIHFTTKGADRIGQILTNSFEYAYQLYLSQKRLSQEKIDEKINID